MADVEYTHTAPTSGWLQAGAAAGGLSLLGNVLGGWNCGNGNGLFNWGNNCNRGCGGNWAEGAVFMQNAELQAKIAKLEAENYSDNNSKNVYAQSLSDNRRLQDQFNTEIATLRANVNILNDTIHKQAVENARTQEQLNCCCQKQEMQAQLFGEKLNSAVLAVKGNYDAAFASLNQTLACLQNTVNGITSTYVPCAKVCTANACPTTSTSTPAAA